MNNVWLPVSGPDKDCERIVKGDGIYIYNADGKKFLDGNSGLWNIPLGYSNTKIRDFVFEQMNKLQFTNPEMFYNDMESQLADALLSIMPDNMKRVFFTCSGSECTEVAIKVIRKFQRLCRKNKKKLIAVFSQSYHGNYWGAMSASFYEVDLRNDFKPLLDGFLELPLPYAHGKQDYSEDICNSIKECLEENKDSLAGIIVEPILGSAGIFPMPAELLRWISTFAKENNILIVYDEITTGIGRTGKLFAFEHIGVQPDIVLLSKGINNGCFPFGAVVLSSKICSAFKMRGDILFHLSTQDGNPICCAAAFETIRQITENDSYMVKDVAIKGAYFVTKLKAELLPLNNVSGIRGLGLMVAVEITEQDGRTILDNEKLYQIVQLLKQKGIICSWNYTAGLTSCLYFLPPYIVKLCEIDFIVQALKDTLNNFDRI